MARAQFYDVGIDASGNAVTSTQVSVYARGTTTLSTIYSNETGSTPKSNPFNASTGFIDFWAEPGEYDIAISDTNAPPAFASKTIGWSSIPGVDGVVEQTIADGVIVNANISTSAAIGYAKLASVPAVSVYHSASQTVSATSAVVAFDTELFDNASLHSTSVNNSRITIPTGGSGIYMLQGSFTGLAVTAGVLEARFLVNGANSIIFAYDSAFPAGVTKYFGGAPVLLQLSAGDYVQIQIYYSASIGISFGAGANNGRFTAIRVST